jgi:hypothetical protein
MITLSGSTAGALRNCEFPGCKEIGNERHHIVYDPGEIAFLCTKHHEDITIINGAKGRRGSGGLSRAHRYYIWRGFLKGEIRPRRTRKAMEYIESGRFMRRKTRG